MSISPMLAGLVNAEPLLLRAQRRSNQNLERGKKLGVGPKLSIVTIAKTENELRPLIDAIEKQTYKNYEIIFSTKGSIPEAWNDAISRATGDYLVFTESDAEPANNNWLLEISMAVRPGTVIKGLEVKPTDLNLCNTVFDASIFKVNKMMFDESFLICEDLELFSRLRKRGIDIYRIPSFPVLHFSKETWKNTLRRAFIQGAYFVKILYLYGSKNTDEYGSRFPQIRKPQIGPVSNRIREIVHHLLVFCGLLVGALVYLPVKWQKR